MPLHELQRRMMDALLSGTLQSAAPWVDLPNAAAISRLGIYRNTVRVNFVTALRSSYPVVWRLVGEDYFRQIALQYHDGHPSRSGDLLHVGEYFAEFVSEQHVGGDFGYLGDVARLERQIEAALLAADHGPLDLPRLAAVDPAAYDELRFELHPASRLFESPYPAVAIWEANISSATLPDPIDLRSGGDRVALIRRDGQLEFHRLNRGEFEFLRALGRRESFVTAVQAGESAGDGFDAATALPRFVAAHVIVDFHPLL